MKKSIARVASAGVLVVASTASANDLGYGFAWSGDFGVTSNDIFQGSSTTGGRPAIFGGFELGHDSGLYLGNANLSVFGGTDDPAYLEMEVYGGYAVDITEAFSVDVGASHYFYPAAGGSAELTEIYGGIGYTFEDLETGLTVIHEADDGDYFEYIGDFTLGMSYGTYLFGELGYLVDDSDATDFAYWYLGVGVTYADLDFSVAYGDNDLSTREGGDGEQFAFTLSTAF